MLCWTHNEPFGLETYVLQMEEKIFFFDYFFSPSSFLNFY